ncbi:DUF397 domain-containing protein [Streptomyces sp. NPDC049585]|uniref:DUF397 domain-containing protein n=1 Tax=Streptomyces sp. NPDC049585 TaxID=3155154 RepID=UPI0034383C78
MNTDWIRSSHSGGAGGDCVEVGSAPRRIRVRDSKRIPGSEVSVSAVSWAAFLAAVTRHHLPSDAQPRHT